MKSVANVEALSVAHRELLEAYQDFSCALARARSTFLYEELLPLAEELDEAFQRFLKASEPFIPPTR